MAELVGMDGLETLQKAIMRRDTNHVADPMELYLPLLVVPRTLLSWLVRNINPMKVGEYKDFKFPGRDDISMHIEKQNTDTYRGEWVKDGKILHVFDKQTLPSVAGAMMTVGEVYDHLADGPKAEGTSMVQAMMAESGVDEEVPGEDEKANILSSKKITSLVSAIGKLVDALVDKKVSTDTFSEAVDGMDKKEIKGDEQKVVETEMPELKGATAKSVMPECKEVETGAQKFKKDAMLETKAEAPGGAAMAKRPTQPVQSTKPTMPSRGLKNLAPKQAQQSATGKVPTAPKVPGAPKMSVKPPSAPKAPTMKGEDKIIEKQAPSPARMGVQKPKIPGQRNKMFGMMGGIGVGGIGVSAIGGGVAGGAGGKAEMDGKAKTSNYFKKKMEILSKPSVSEAQRRAMGAAASGHSTLGIPKKVGKEFIDADKGGKLPETVKKYDKNAARSQMNNMFGSATPTPAPTPTPTPTPTPPPADSLGAEFGGAIDRKIHKSESLGKGTLAVLPSNEYVGQAKDKIIDDFRQAYKDYTPQQHIVEAEAHEKKVDLNLGGSGTEGIDLHHLTQARIHRKLAAEKTQQAIAPMIHHLHTLKDRLPPILPTKKSESIVVTSEQLNRKCAHCGTSEFKKSEDGKMVFAPCACFQVEENSEVPFVQVKKSENGAFELEFSPKADPESIRAFLLTLKARLMINRAMSKHGA